MSAPIATELPGALKRARKAAGFTNAKRFLAALKEAEGSAPSYSTYAQWESGEVTPREESLRPVLRYHEARGTWVNVEAAPDLPTALLALARELAALREERTALRAQVDELQATVELLVERTPLGQGTAAPAGPGVRLEIAGSDR